MYVLVDVLDIVIVLFQSGVFEYLLFCVRVVVATRVFFGLCFRLLYSVVSEWCFRLHIYIGLQWLGGGGAVVHICKTYLCTPRKLLRGAKNEGARYVWEFQRSPSRFSQVWLNA